MPGIPKAEQSQQTREILLRAARKLFTEKGYASTSTEEIVQRAHVTRGALYYHYRDKADIFRAVFEEVRLERVRLITETIQAAEGDPWQRFAGAGFQVFLETIRDPDVQRIVFTDGPAVLGLAVVRDNSPGLIFLRNTLTHLMDTGEVEQIPVGPLSAILWAALFESGMYVAHAAPDDAARVQEEATDILQRIFSVLRTAPQQETT